MTDLMAGRVDMLFASILETVTYVQAGKLRALAVTGPERSAAMPDVPTLDEAGVHNAQTGSWTAVLAPAGTPQAVVDKLSAAIRAVAAKPDVKQKLEAQGAVAHGSTPAELADIAARERARYGDIIKARNLHV
jgi:tripartite-type tricarboxylate transporter receptor subunit TctC